ncbi:MAG: hypothetical protein AMJ46_12815 [Latescibacteria bacterium DG_63]|nr:MAG: hypothetical protein AMJ46_12815 [Latescibacteria bacterium DG_63]
MILPDRKVTNEVKRTFWSRPATIWDPVWGYKWSNQENRILRVAHGEIVADNRYKYNNYHQHCSFDYSPRKASANIYRFVVLGNSFTNDIMLHMAWPETLHHLLNSRKEFTKAFEVYSFPTDGGGLVNWHTTFKELIDKMFDYDALIIADWGDDLSRNWAISFCNATELRWISVDLSERPKTQEEFETLLPQSKTLGYIQSEEKIEALAQKLRDSADPRPMKPADYVKDGPRVELAPDHYEFSKEVFIRRYGEMRYVMLDEIIQICKSKEKAVIYSTLPTREGLIYLQNAGKKLMAQVQGEGLCKHFGIHFFDGFKAFEEIDSQSLIDFYWLKHDGHWNLGASIHYALKLAEWIFQTKIFTE